MHPADGPDEVAVGHVGQGGKVGFDPTGGRNGAAGADPLTSTLCVWFSGGIYDDAETTDQHTLNIIAQR